MSAATRRSRQLATGTTSAGGTATNRAKRQADLADFCAREHPRLLRSLTFYTGDPLVAEEFAQDALLSACRRWSDVREMAAPGAWVHRVGMNAANRYFRRRGVERRALRRRRNGAADAYQLPDSAQAIALRDAVVAMPERQRAAVIMRYFLDLSVDQVAATLDITPQATRALTYRGLEHLRSRRVDFLGEESPDVE